MGIFTQKIRLFRIIFQILFRLHRRGIHPAFKIRRTLPAPVVTHIFIVDRAALIPIPEIHTHVIQILAAPGFISHAPGENTGMIFVPFQHRFRPAQDRFMPLREISRQSVVVFSQMPGPVRFQIRLVHHIDPEPVAQFVPVTLIGIMTGTDSIDIVPF